VTASTSSIDTAQATVATPASALLAARLGGALALAAAASLSFNALCDLARRAGLGGLAALLPIAIDAFAASALFVAYRLPLGHSARRTTGRTARLALALTVGCNGLDHLLDLAGYLLTRHVRDLLLVIVASLPPLIVERLLHLQTTLVEGLETAGTEPAPDSAGHAAGHEEDDDSQDGRGPKRSRSSRPDDDRWVAVAAPVYRELVERTGRRPSETAFCSALNGAITGQGKASGADGSVPGRRHPVSLSTAKRVRALVEGQADAPAS
jgi:uncharacterized protein DUF2637